MKTYKQTLMTIFVVFATAYVLTIMGCAKSKDVSGAPQPAAAEPEAPQVQDDDSVVLQPIPLNEMRECTPDEFSDLIKWSNDLSAADEAIANNGTRKNDTVVKLALKAIDQCDKTEFYHSLKPCKKITKLVPTPNNPKIVGYDAFNVRKRCEKVNKYLTNLKLRPDRRQSQPSEPSLPAEPTQPSQPTPVEPPTARPPVDAGQLQQCSADEFAKLNIWRSALDLANKNIAKLGNQSNWKYDANAIESSRAATLACESVISYHDSKPCKREKSYTGQNLREQCATARTYYYSFAQRSESMIVSGAKLLLDTSVIADRTFHPGPAERSYGNCVITNQSDSVIQYGGQKTLITESRVYTNAEDQMFVIVTQENLKLECYGLNYSSAATSLTEVMKLLFAEDTKLPMNYELN